MMKLIATTFAAYNTVVVESAGEYWKKDQMVEKMTKSIDDLPAIYAGARSVIEDNPHSSSSGGARWQAAKAFRNSLLKTYRTTISQARNKVKTIYLESLAPADEKDMWDAMVTGRNAINSAYGQFKWKHIKKLNDEAKEQAWLDGVNGYLETAKRMLKYTKSRGGI